ncbi:MAG: Crp/Fnr family transcriptional regulator [Nitrospirota bacterium]
MPPTIDHTRLPDLPIFSALTEAGRRDLAEHTAEVRYDKGEHIFREGEPAEYFHVLLSGTVKCVKSSPEGKEAVLKVLAPGDMFCCEAAVFDGGEHPGCAQPTGPVKVLKIAKQAYFRLLKDNPEAALEIIRYLGHRLNESQETAKTFALERADQRVASLLARLAERIGKDIPGGLLLDIQLGRQDIADMTGLALETTIRTISKLTRDGLLGKSGRSLVVKDLKGLKALTASPA